MSHQNSWGAWLHLLSPSHQEAAAAVAGSWTHLLQEVKNEICPTKLPAAFSAVSQIYWSKAEFCWEQSGSFWGTLGWLNLLGWGCNGRIWVMSTPRVILTVRSPHTHGACQCPMVPYSHRKPSSLLYPESWALVEQDKSVTVLHSLQRMLWARLPSAFKRFQSHQSWVIADKGLSLSRHLLWNAPTPTHLLAQLAVLSLRTANPALKWTSRKPKKYWRQKHPVLVV